MDVLLPIHILAGSIALASAAVALSSAKGKKTHIISGRAYFWSMFVIFSTALPMSIINNNIFLFLISIFSFYLAFSGTRFAQNRGGIPTILDWIAVGFMMFSGISMWVLSAIYYFDDNSQFITLLVFGSLANSLGFTDLRSYKNKTTQGKDRIARHLTNMMGGTIAVTTAVLVVNPPSDPEWLWWILPTALITPVIFWWNRKVLNPKSTN